METLTLQRLGISGALYRKLRTTNAIENLNSGVATYTRNVKRWQGGPMVVRWVSVAIQEAETKFRRVQGTAISRSSRTPSKGSTPKMMRQQSASPKIE